MKVAFLDLEAAHSELRETLEPELLRVARSGWYVLGPEVEAFEQQFAEYCGARYAIGVANGLDALHLSLAALGIGPGDEVLVPSNTYIATWLAVTHAGALPVPVEPVEATFNIDPDRLEAAITPRTKAIIPVHLYGQPVDLDPVMSVAANHGLSVVEDAAQAHGARYRGRRIGGHGDAVAWSFYPGKNLGALGDGGAVTTNDGTIADRLRVLRNYGSRVKYENETAGFNSRLDPLQAAVLSVKLGKLDEWNARRNSTANRYLDGLKHTDLVLPKVPEWADPVWHQFVVRHRERDAFQRRLAQAGIETMIHYPVPPHRQACYAGLDGPPGKLPMAETLSSQVLSLPIGPHLRADQQDHVIEKVVALY